MSAPPGDDVLAEMRRLAEAATPGPWRADEKPDEDGDQYVEAIDPADGQWWVVAEVGYWMNSANAAYIAAVHPQAVLAVLDALAAAREAIALSRCGLPDQVNICKTACKFCLDEADAEIAARAHLPQARAAEEGRNER